jgi:hypothetical protein
MRVRVPVGISDTANLITTYGRRPQRASAVPAGCVTYIDTDKGVETARAGTYLERVVVRGFWFGSAALVGLLTMLAPASPAWAHVGGRPQPDSAFYRTGLAGVEPQPIGVTVRVDPAGEWIELTNGGPAAVIVLGYTREPYLRVTASTVEENQLSQTTYLNKSLFADSIPTGQDGGGVAPSWRQIGNTGAVRWHDHRIHWMGQNRPPVVSADPRHAHPVGTWTVHATVDGQPFEIHGDLRWIGKPDTANANQPIPIWLLILLESLVLVIGVLVLLLVRLRRELRQPAVQHATHPVDPVPHR